MDPDRREPLSPAELNLMHAWWRAADYLSVARIYLLNNPLVERPLERADIKPHRQWRWPEPAGVLS